MKLRRATLCLLLTIYTFQMQSMHRQICPSALPPERLPEWNHLSVYSERGRGLASSDHHQTNPHGNSRPSRRAQPRFTRSIRCLPTLPEQQGGLQKAGSYGGTQKPSTMIVNHDSENGDATYYFTVALLVSSCCGIGVLTNTIAPMFGKSVTLLLGTSTQS